MQEYPCLNKNYTSFFRNDKNPGCKFYIDKNNSLKFIDFSIGKTYNCFDFISEYYNIDNFPDTLSYIYNRLLKYKEINLEHNKKVYKSKTDKYKIKKLQDIKIFPRYYNNNDVLYWSQYGISIDNLKSDKVYAISKYKLIYKNSIKTISPHNLTYAYTDFRDNRMKIYMPNNKLRFINNCNKNDIGNINNIKNINRLIITKSYKDCRVLTNNNLNAIWFQSENISPSLNILKNIVKDKNIIILYDNDESGIIGSKKLYMTISNITNCELMYTKSQKDISDLYRFDKLNFNKTINILIKWQQKEK